ncbi:hypothetical protein HNDCFFNB_00118 [Citrobacter phage BSwM KMM2]|nr:hypothetical protein HNDCFFNB_00118 [Citrobacter phage BSwM KMM2]
MLEVGKVYLFVGKVGGTTLEAKLKYILDNGYVVSWQTANGTWYDEKLTGEFWKVYQEVKL